LCSRSRLTFKWHDGHESVWTARALRSAAEIGRIAVIGDPSLNSPGLRELGAAVTAEGADLTAFRARAAATKVVCGIADRFAKHWGIS
jgi:hypothetical protein